MVVVTVYFGGSAFITFCRVFQAFWDGAAFLSVWRTLRCQPLFLSLPFSNVFPSFLFLPVIHGSLCTATLLSARGTSLVACLLGCGHDNFLLVSLPIWFGIDMSFDFHGSITSLRLPGHDR